MKVHYSIKEVVNCGASSKAQAEALDLVYYEGIKTFRDNMNLHDLSDLIIEELAKSDSRINTRINFLEEKYQKI